MHMYMPSSSIKLKTQNWEVLNVKVLKKLGINLKSADIQKLVQQQTSFIQTDKFKRVPVSTNTYIDHLFYLLQTKISQFAKNPPEDPLLRPVFEKEEQECCVD